jgi:hypothetical protein
MKPKTPPEVTEWIEAYLRHELSGEDLALFKQQMVMDPAFAAEVEFMELTHALLDDHLLFEDVRQIHAEKVLEWQADEEHATQTPVIPLPIVPANVSTEPSLPAIQRSLVPQRSTAVPLWGRSAAAAAVAGVALVGYLSLAPISIDDEVRMTTRGGSTEIRERPSQLCYDNFYTGKALLQANQPIQAIGQLEQVATCEVRPYFKDASKWYLTLAYLEAEQIPKAETLYKEITQAPTFRYAIKPVNRWKLWWRLRWSKLRR